MAQPKAGRGPQQIRISIETREPLSGSATADTGETFPFEGWLELLHVLARLTDPDGDPGPTRDQGSQDGS